ncbi:MAG: GNAT family N-acetyltransferase, partial [Sediminibacterium sp.]|nr:GNAT family N-acetyltransferase [Sediminibacterium sp.]
NEQYDYFFIILENNDIIGCCILTTVTEQIIKLRQMAIHPNYQRKNIGKSLIQYCEKFAFKQNYQQIVLHARETALGFYKKNGYAAIGDFFIEVSIPHIKMFKNIQFEN